MFSGISVTRRYVRFLFGNATGGDHLMYGFHRYRLHRMLPMRVIRGVERWLYMTYRRTRSAWSKRWLDRVSWFTTPYEGARRDSGLVDAMNHWTEVRHYGLHRHGSTNVRWEMYRTTGEESGRALGLNGGSHGR